MSTRRVRIAAWLLLGVAGSSGWTQPADIASARPLVDSAVAELHVDAGAARRDAEAALRVLQRMPDADTEVDARLILAQFYLTRDRAACQAQLDAIETLLPQTTRPGLRSAMLTGRGRLLMTSGDGEQAASIFDQAVQVADSAQDEQMLAEALLARGSLRGQRGAYATALADLRHAQAVFEKLGLQERELTALNAIGISYDRMGDAEEATHIFQRTLDALRTAGLKVDEAATLRAQGDAYSSLRQWNLAREAYSQSIDLSRQSDNQRGEAYALRGLAMVATAQDDASRALTLLDRAALLQHQTPDARLAAQIELASGMALHHLGRLKPGFTALSQALAIFHQYGSPNELATIYNELAAVDAEMGNWRDAFEYRSLAQTLTTQLLRSQLDQRFATLKVEFDTASKEEENRLLMSENAANQTALAQRLRASNLQMAVIILGIALLGLLAWLVVHQRRASAQLRQLAMTDELTGIPNRRALLTLLSQTLRRDSGPISILIIDMDHFKSINDRFGHLVGDEALKKVSADLSDALAGPAVFGRLGGEEFAAVLPNTGSKDAFVLAEDLRERVFRLDMSRWLGERRLTVSVGVATSVPQDSISSMLRRADSALYAAKDAGRNCVRSKPADEDREPTTTSRVA
ncbi:MAG TPA: diguanylate cyclase [Steroidobacteraceae bacterium]|nr:diguanylate cyclase [Steroidobacteraceae bacterium]